MTVDPAAPTGTAAMPKKRPWWFYALIVLGVSPFGCLCVGMGASLAIPAFVRYVKTGKAAEADALLASMRRGTVEYCRREGHLPAAGGPTPDGPPGATKQVADVNRHPTLAAIGFSPTTPLYYRYSIDEEPGGVVLRAVGDLDADQVLSVRTIRCDASCACGGMEVVDELE